MKIPLQPLDLLRVVLTGVWYIGLACPQKQKCKRQPTFADSQNRRPAKISMHMVHAHMDTVCVCVCVFVHACVCVCMWV